MAHYYDSVFLGHGENCSALATLIPPDFAPSVYGDIKSGTGNTIAACLDVLHHRQSLEKIIAVEAVEVIMEATQKKIETRGIRPPSVKVVKSGDRYG